jgi:hypothetical protein
VAVRSLSQGYQMVYFQTKNPILGKFWRVLLVYFMAVWYRYFTANWWIWWSFCTYILWLFDIFFLILIRWTKKNLATLVWGRHLKFFIIWRLEGTTTR